MGTIVCKIAAHPVPEAFSECGGLVGQISGNKTLGTDEVIAEAIRDGHVMGQPEYVKGHLTGVLKSMIDHISLDGNGRKIDGYFSFVPYLRGRIEDIAGGVDKEKNYVEVVARALKEMKIDTSGWTFVIESGEGSLHIYNISTGEVEGVVRVGNAITVTGSGTTMGTGDSIAWTVPGTSKGGTFAAANITSDATTIVINDQLSELASSEYDGKTIVLTFHVGGKKAVKSAVLKTSVTQTTNS